jgi:hypothetical protein
MRVLCTPASASLLTTLSRWVAWLWLAISKECAAQCNAMHQLHPGQVLWVE